MWIGNNATIMSGVKVGDALYVQHLIRNEDFSEELVTYWRKMHFSDLFSMSSKSESEKCNIKLTVM